MVLLLVFSSNWINLIYYFKVVLQTQILTENSYAGCGQIILKQY